MPLSSSLPSPSLQYNRRPIRPKRLCYQRRQTMQLYQRNSRLGLIFVALVTTWANALTMTRSMPRHQSPRRSSAKSSFNVHADTILPLRSSGAEEFDGGCKSEKFRDIDSYSYASCLEALQAYYKIHGDLVIPRSFEVPFTKGKVSVRSWHFRFVAFSFIHRDSSFTNFVLD